MNINTARRQDLLRKLDMNKIPIKVKVQAFYASVHEAVKFIEEVILPQLKVLEEIAKASKKSLPKKDKYLIAMYNRVYLWMKSVEALNNTVYFQTVTSAARAIFDLFLDIKLIIDNRPTDSIRKLEAFMQVEKFRAAEEYSNFIKSNPHLRDPGNLKREEFANKPGERVKIEKIRRLHWGSRKTQVNHWSGWGTKKRAQEAGKEFELLYYEFFAFWSWYIHPAGLVGFKNIKTDTFKVIFGSTLNKIVDMFCDITELIAKALDLMPAMAEFDNWMRHISIEVPGQIIIDYETQKLKE